MKNVDVGIGPLSPGSLGIKRTQVKSNANRGCPIRLSSHIQQQLSALCGNSVGSRPHQMEVGIKSINSFCEIPMWTAGPNRYNRIKYIFRSSALSFIRPIVSEWVSEWVSGWVREWGREGGRENTDELYTPTITRNRYLHNQTLVSWTLL